jgi:hypothetical protein
MSKKKDEVKIPPLPPGPWLWDPDHPGLCDAKDNLLLEVRKTPELTDPVANAIVAVPALVAAIERLNRELTRFGPTDDGVERAMDEGEKALLYAKYGINPDSPEGP